MLVKKGQLLVLLDDADARIALAQARADLGQVERKVRGYFATDIALGGQVNSREADIAGADAQARERQGGLRAGAHRSRSPPGTRRLRRRLGR